MLKGSEAQARRRRPWFWVDQGHGLTAGLGDERRYGGVEAPERPFVLWKHRPERGFPKTLGPTEKETAEGEEGSHNLPREAAKGL